MQCKNCGSNNSPNARYCIKCSKELIEIENQDEYCLKCGMSLLYPDKPCPYCFDNLNLAEHTFCTQCKKGLKDGIIFSNIKRLNDLEKFLLNLDGSQVFCGSCIKDQKNKAYENLVILKNKFQTFINEIPILSVENLVNLTITKYCEIISSQSVVEVKSINEFSNDFNIWDNPTNDFEYKLKLAESSCFLSLRKEALKLEANAIIKCDINYAEISSSNSSRMFLVALMGTAIVVEEFGILTEYEQKVFNYLCSDILNC